jgi:hypothetical protein
MVSMTATGSVRPKSPRSARHQVAHRVPVLVRRERDAHARFAQRFIQRMLHVGAPLAPGEVAVDAHHVVEVPRRQQAHFRRVARELLVVVGRRRAPVVRIAALLGPRRSDGFLARAERAPLHRALQDLDRRERVAGAVEEFQHRMIAPGGSRAQLGDGALFSLLFQRGVQRASDAAPLRGPRHADHLETQAGPGAAELALEHAAQGVPAQHRALLGRELHVQLRLAQRGGQPPLEIRAPGAARHLRVERHHRVKIGARKPPYFQFM